jgi:sulfur carrier protein ThiS
MRVQAELLPSRSLRTAELPAGATGRELLGHLGLSVDAHILVRGDVPLPEDEPLREGERLVVIQVASGG